MSEQSKGVVSLKAGFIFQKVGATEGEPVIDASGMSDEQIFEWMDKKLVAAKRLRDLLSTKAAIEEQLINLNSEIEHATLLSQIEVYRKD